VIEVEELFLFIEDPILRRNVSLAYQYAVFLTDLLDQGGTDTSISSSIHKDMIVQAACTVEACLHYCLRKSIASGKIESGDVMPNEEKYLDQKLLYRISEDEHLLAVRKVRKPEHLSRQTQFITLNRAALKAGIFDRSTFDKSEELRQMRNKIHLAGLASIDGSYRKTDSNHAFLLAKAVLDAIEKWLDDE
jgi:hypothetical protein